MPAAAAHVSSLLPPSPAPALAQAQYFRCALVAGYGSPAPLANAASYGIVRFDFASGKGANKIAVGQPYNFLPLVNSQAYPTGYPTYINPNICPPRPIN